MRRRKKTEHPVFKNPFRPGAGHMPPYLAGREQEQKDFARLLEQETILRNLVLTGLRGVGKTVLLDTFKPLALREGWLWVGTDLSETTNLNEENIAIRLLTDLSVVTSSILLTEVEQRRIGFARKPERLGVALSYETLMRVFDATPGLVSDKLKGVLELVRSAMVERDRKHCGILFAYDEAQNLADHSGKEQFPLSLLLDVFQSIQRKEIPFMLVLTGLPTLFPKLVEARTFAERMFHVMILDRLNRDDSRDAIVRPIEADGCPVSFGAKAVETIIDVSGGYPYFLQFICREAYDVALQKLDEGDNPIVPIEEILRKLDTDFFAGRWARATDRQRELMMVIAGLKDADGEFTVQEIVERSRKSLQKPFSSSHVSQMLSALCDSGLVYKNRHGRYSFAVPLLGQYISRQVAARR